MVCENGCLVLKTGRWGVEIMPSTGVPVMGPFGLSPGGVVNFQLKAGVLPTISLNAVSPALIPGTLQQKV